MLRIDEVPQIDVHVIKSGEAPGGIGETGTTAGPPALRNAIYAATGVALRRLPIDREPAGREEEGHEAGDTSQPSGRRRVVVVVVAAACGSARAGSHGFCRRPEGGAGRLSRRRSDRRSGGACQGESRRARRISCARRRLHGLPHRPGRQALRRRPGVQAALRHALLDQHHAGQGDRHRQLQRPGIPRRHASRHAPRRRAALSGDAVPVLHLHDRRRCAGDQGLSLQPRAGAGAARRRTR